MTGTQIAVYETMKEFITTKYYATEEIAVEILISFRVTADITPTEATELVLLAREVYNPYVPPVDEPTVIPEI